MPSTAISDIAYDPESETLRVTFISSGRRYAYYGVPAEVYDRLRAAPSKGAFLNAGIKPHYECELVFDAEWGKPVSGPISATIAKPTRSP